MEWFWYFVIYSFLGFCLEVLFARVTQQSKRDRKCFLFLPLCPVYGLGALWILALPAPVRDHPILLFLGSALAATGAEYAMSLFYERLTGVHFWDYRHLPFHLHGRVCLLFSVFWGILGVGAIHVLHPAVIRFTAQLPLSMALCRMPASAGRVRYTGSPAAYPQHGYPMLVSPDSPLPFTGFITRGEGR